MALHTLGSTTTTALNAVTYQPRGVLSEADLAAIQQGIVSDVYAQATAPGGVKTTGTTHSSTSVDSIASMTRIKAGMFVLGIGIVPGTTVQAVNVAGSAITLSQAATASAAGVNLLFVPVNQDQVCQFNFNGLLTIPRRGTLMVFPGDVVARDPTTGWPILVSAAAIAASGSLWNLV